MNYNAMTDLELLHYLDLYSDDPLIRRLIDVLVKTRGSIISDLEAVGMDPQTWTFRDHYDSMYPGQYIEDLRSQLRHAEDELNDVKDELDRVTEQRDELKTRSIMTFVQEVWDEKQHNEQIVRDTMTTIKTYKEENDRLREQLDMWARMNQPERNSL